MNTKMIQLLERVWYNQGFSPADLDKLSVDELEIMLQARDDGLIGYAVKQFIVSSNGEIDKESRLVLTTQGYAKVWNEKRIMEYKEYVRARS